MNYSLISLSILASATLSAHASSFLVDFNTDDSGNALTQGTVDFRTTQPYANLFGTNLGIRFSTDDPTNQPLNLYNTEGVGGRDDDLERNTAANTPNGVFAGGNAISTIHGNALIINEFSDISTIDDEGSGGTVTIESDVDLVGFEFSYIDLDTPNGLITLRNNSVDIGTISFAALQDANSADFDNTFGTLFANTGADFGDRHSNTITSLTQANLQSAFPGFTIFDEISITTSGSGGIGSFNFTTIPEPSTSATLALGLSTILLRRSRRS